MSDSPPLKWPGGKGQLLSELRNRLPSSAVTGRYHEPFIGGGALFFDTKPQSGSINDRNPRLINFYEQVQTNPEALIQRCREFPDPESAPEPSLEFAEEDHKGKSVDEFYYQQRARFNKRPYTDEPLPPLEEAAVLLYLNRTCYNGLYRENQSGGFNASLGGYDDPDWVRVEEVRHASTALDGIDIHCGDFSYIEEVAEAGDVVYFDPPYEPVSASADFTNYSAGGFDRDDQLRLLETAKTLVDAGVSVLLSNSAVMHDFYADEGFEVDFVEATRVINIDPDNRGAVDEIIARNIADSHTAQNIQSKLGAF